MRAFARIALRLLGVASPAREQTEALINRWGQRARRTERAHYQAANRFTRLNTLFTFAVVSLSTFAGSGVFATIRNRSEVWSIALGVVAVFSAILAAFQRHRGYEGLAAQHRAAGSGWSAILDRVEQVQAGYSEDPVTPEVIEELRRAMQDLVSKSPEIPKTFFERNRIEETYGANT